MQKVAIIGAGKVGATLAIALGNAGIDIIGVLNKSQASAGAVAAKLGCCVFQNAAELASVAEIIIIAVPDREIVRVAGQLLESGAMDSSKTVFHTCGAQSGQILSCLVQSGANIGSMHPLQAFSTIDLAVAKLKGTYFAVDGNARAVEIAKRLVAAIGGNLIEIAAEHRPLYHAAACVASNYMVAVVYGAVQMLNKLGIAEKDALLALRPILQGTVDNLTENGTVKALTGPIARGDTGTLAKHLVQINALSANEAELYRNIGIYAINIVRAQEKLSEEKMAEIKSVLMDQE